MAEAFSFNARQYFDFSRDQDDHNVDSFFDMVEEVQTGAQYPKQYEDVVESELHEASDENNDCFFSPLDNSHVGADSSAIHLKGRLRKSLSLNNLPKGNDAEQESSDLSCTLKEVHLDELPHPPRPKSVCSLHGRSSKAPSKEHINRLAQPKRFTSHDNLNDSKSMTLAEAVLKFQAGTPKRFRSEPSSKINKVVPISWGGTKPQTPKLMTTKRVRPVTAISKEEQEAKEMEEARKFKIKANPVSKKVLRGPLKPQVERKAPTVAEPFNLTEVKKKTESKEEEKAPVFRAQPIPKSLNNPFKPQVSGQTTTKAESTRISKGLSKSTPGKNVQSDRKKETPQSSKLTRTQPVPFSFEKRDQQLMKKKEEMINRIFEEERKAREFHARPPPKAILKSRNSSQDRISETGSSRSAVSTDELETTIFKARPATVLHMKPFEPKKDENHIVKIEAFQLSTEHRLEARRKFEEKIKEKEALAEAHKKQMENMQKMLEEEEVAKLRKQMEYKAQPIKKYKEIKIESAHKVTEPKSPKFHTDRIRNKENIH